MTAVAADAVTVERAGARLLDGVSLTADSSELVGVIGPNGAGKTTLLRVLAGDLAPAAGAARVLDHDPSRTSPDQLSRVRAYLGPRQDGDVLFTVREVVTMGRHPHRRATLAPAEHDEIVDQAMRQVGVDHLADRAVRDLSTGEQQRVGLARVLAQQTPVLLLDEPTAVLDIAHQETVMRLLRTVSDRGTAVVIVLHDLNLAAAHADRLLLLSDGRMLTAGAPAEVLTGETLSSVYRQPMTVIPHPHRNCPLVLTVE